MRFPNNVFTHGSKLTDCINVVANVFCRLFAFYTPVGRAAFLATSLPEAPASIDVLNIRLALNDLIENHKKIALQWAPAHCGLQGNETAESLAKEATKILGLPS
ncbi:hypothetical protein TNCV_2931441 [Trichonephila clavipes]|nr:hypothetical protein TNCV_2931441 [Trichonephila clavipes]